jgi:phosphoribosylglycinamide formyltransferase-1
VSLRLGVLVSGGGTNLQAILDAIDTGRLDASCQVVVSNRPGVFALTRAARSGKKTAVLDHKAYASREAFDEALVQTLIDHGVEWLSLIHI